MTRRAKFNFAHPRAPKCMRLSRFGGRGLGRGGAWLGGLIFEVHRRKETESAVEPRAVVEDFDIFEDRQAGLGPRRESALGQKLGFEGAPEALHMGVVVTVAAAAHAGHEPRFLEEGLIS